MRTAQSDDRSGARFSATSRQEGGANPPTPVRCDTCGVAGCVGECGAVAGERERRADLRAGWLIVAVGLATLLCPGCGADPSDTDGGHAVLFVAVVVATALALRQRAAARQWGERYRESSALHADLLGRLDRHRAAANAQVRDLQARLDDAAQVIQRADRALDDCAALLDGKRGDAEWAAARKSLRATGRLGATRTCKRCGIGVVLTDSKGVAACAMCGEVAK